MHGHLDATTDEVRIRNWWDRSPDSNIGIRTGAESGIIVLDVDPRHGGDETFADLESAHGKVPATVESITGGGGRHLYFAYPGFEVRSSAGRLGPGLDVRADGGYIVAPPSVTTGPYLWEVSSHPDDVDLALMPPWLGGLLTEASDGRYHAAGPLPQVIPLGQRNAILTSLAGSMRRRGASEAAIMAALAIENGRCEVPLSRGELLTIAASIAGYEPGPTMRARIRIALP